MYNLVHQENPIKEMIHLKMKSMHNKISKQEIERETEAKITFPLMVNIDIEDNEDLLEREGLDLILVVDVSGSMRGEKIDLVDKTLDFIIDELEAKDRLSIILFNTSTSLLCEMVSMDADAKKRIKKRLKKDLVAGGGTNIKRALEGGLKVFEKQTESRALTSMFLISDGQDICGNKTKDFKACMKKCNLLKARKKKELQVCSFGYGEDHDEKLLNMIANESGGSFYYIKTLKFIDECIIDCFGKLMSNFVTDARLKVDLRPGVQFECVEPNTWQKKTKRAVSGKVSNLAIGKSQHFMFEVSIQLSKLRMEVGDRFKVGSVALKLMVQDEQVLVDDVLELEMVEKMMDRGELNLDVAQNFTKFQAVKVMQETKNKLRKGLKGKGKEVLESFLSKMEGDARLGKDFKSNIKSQLSMSNLQNDKNFFQVQHILNNDVYNPDFQAKAAPKFNKRQRAMQSKRRKKK